MSHKFLMHASTKGLKDLKCPSIYNGSSTKKKTDLIEMIIYRCMTGTLDKREIEDISNKEAKHILNKNKVSINLLPGYGHMGIRKKDIKPCVKEESYVSI